MSDYPRLHVRILRQALVGAAIVFCLAAGVAIPSPVQVTNPADPPLVETWGLREVWRLGGDDDAADAPLLGVISKGMVDADGNVLLLDTQLGHVLVISSDGRFLHTLGRVGEGPGEINQPQDMCIFSDGTVGLMQSFPIKIIKLNRDGTPAGSITVDNPALNFWRLRTAAGVTVVTGQRNDYEMKTPGKSESYRFIMSLDAQGAEKHVYLDKTVITQWTPPVSDEGNNTFSGYLWDLTPDGTVVLAPERDRYHLEFIDPEGTLLRTVDRPFTPYRRTNKDKDEVRDNMTMTTNGKELEVKKIVLDTAPAIREVTILDDGTIWVKNCYGDRDLPDGVFTRYDVLDPEGHFLKEVRLECPARREQDGFSLLQNGRFLWLRNLTSAYKSMYPGMKDGDDEAADSGDVMLEVIVLEREL